jgi:pimeloyl-ACP methyl ester carboxylesterase
MLERLGWPERILAPEFPGFGGEPFRPGWSIADVGERLEALVEERSPDGTAVVCGLSMGGYAALALAIRAPERVAGLILADTRAEADTAEARAVRGAAIELIRAEGAGPFLDGLLPNLMSPDVPASIASTVRSIADDQPGETIIGALEALAGRPSRLPALASIATPTRVIVGADDGVTPLDASRVMVRALANAELHVLPGVGHFSAIEALRHLRQSFGLCSRTCSADPPDRLR